MPQHLNEIAHSDKFPKTFPGRLWRWRVIVCSEIKAYFTDQDEDMEATLTEFFQSIKNPEPPIIVENVVNDIKEGGPAPTAFYPLA